MAREGLRLTQYLVEPACTPSRAALMTGQYSIRNGLSLIAIEGSPNTLSAHAFTMGEMFKDAGYATAIFGKWHLGGDPQSLPTAHGFDEFYGIPPDISWDACNLRRYDRAHPLHSDAARRSFARDGPQIVEAKAGGPLRTVKPFTPEVRANIDNELMDKSIDFMRRQKAAGKPFFLYLPFSMGHVPNLPSQQFKGKSRIGNYGDKLMEGDYHVGQILDTLKELGVDDNTIVVFASDNGPYGEAAREFGNQGTPDMGNSGPFRGELGEATEGAIRTCGDYPLARQDQAEHHVVRDVLDHGFLADIRAHRRRQDAHGPADRRRGPDRCLARQQRDGASREPLELHRRRPGRRALEAVAHLLHRHSSDRQWTAAPAGHFLGQRSDGRLPEGLQHRDGPARGPRRRGIVRLGGEPALKAVESILSR